MTGARIELEIDDVAARDAVRRLLDFADDQGAVMDEIGAAMVVSTQRRFEQGVDPDGQPWKPSWRAQSQGGKTLIDNGNLFGSLTHNAGPNSVEWGSDLIYAAIHQFGGVIEAKDGGKLRFPTPDGGFRTADRVEIPQRAFLGFSDEDDAIVADIVAEEIVRRWEAGS